MTAGSLGWNTLERKVKKGLSVEYVNLDLGWNKTGKRSRPGETHSKGWGRAEGGARAEDTTEALSLHSCLAGTDFASQIQLFYWCSLFFCSQFEQKLARFAFSF